jgi:hypothetical protein
MQRLETNQTDPLRPPLLNLPPFFQRLCAAASANPGLVSLELPGNGITDNGARAVALLLRCSDQQLARLALDNNRIGDAGAVRLAEVCVRTCSVYLLPCQ